MGLLDSLFGGGGSKTTATTSNEQAAGQGAQNVGGSGKGNAIAPTITIGAISTKDNRPTVSANKGNTTVSTPSKNSSVVGTNTSGQNDTSGKKTVAPPVANDKNIIDASAGNVNVSVEANTTTLDADLAKYAIGQNTLLGLAAASHSVAPGQGLGGSGSPMTAGEDQQPFVAPSDSTQTSQKKVVVAWVIVGVVAATAVVLFLRSRKN